MAESRSPKRHLPRKQTIVDRKFQLQFAALVFLVQLIASLSYQATLQLRLSKLFGEVSIPEAAWALDTAGRMSFETLLIVAVVSGGLVFLLGLWFSNRIVGPLPRFRRALDQMAQGDLSVRIHLRPGDVLEHFAEDFNEAMARLEELAAQGRLVVPAPSALAPTPQPPAGTLGEPATQPIP